MVNDITSPTLINFRRTDESVAAVFRSWDAAIEDAGRDEYARTLVITPDAKTGLPNFAFVVLSAKETLVSAERSQIEKPHSTRKAQCR